MCLPERPGAARIAIAGLDISQPPLDLGGRVRHPVRARGGHLVPGQSLRNAVRTAGILGVVPPRSEEHTSELQSQSNLVCRLLLEKKKRHNRAVLPWQKIRCLVGERLAVRAQVAFFLRRRDRLIACSFDTDNRLAEIFVASAGCY